MTFMAYWHHTDSILIKMAAPENFYSDNGRVLNRYQAIIKTEDEKYNSVQWRHPLTA